MPTTSPTLLHRLRTQADPVAWASFVELYTPLLIHWARRNGLQDQDASDLTQEVFSLLLEKLRHFQYDPNKKFRSWLRVVAQRKWYEMCRQRAPAPIGSDDDLQRLSDLTADDDPFWEHEYRQILAVRALSVMRDAFEETTWQACWKVIVLGEPVAQVAADLGLTPGAVYTAKSRVLKRLRDEFADLLD